MTTLSKTLTFNNAVTTRRTTVDAKLIHINASLTKNEYDFLIGMLNARCKERTPKSLLAKLVKANDEVEITCYNKTEKMNRSEAIDFYKECADNSDGCERERYMLILDGLRLGCTKVSDQRGF